MRRIPKPFKPTITLTDWEIVKDKDRRRVIGLSKGGHTVTGPLIYIDKDRGVAETQTLRIILKGGLDNNNVDNKGRSDKNSI